MQKQSVRLAGCLALIALLGSEVATAEEKLNITSPKQEDTVERQALVHGKARNRKAPVFVLVRPLNDRYWWVQQLPGPSNQDGSWEAQCQFGDSKKGNGEEFEIIAIQTNHPLREGEKYEVVPQNSVHSQTIRVRRRDPKISPSGKARFGTSAL